MDIPIFTLAHELAALYRREARTLVALKRHTAAVQPRTMALVLRAAVRAHVEDQVRALARIQRGHLFGRVVVDERGFKKLVSSGEDMATVRMRQRDCREWMQMSLQRHFTRDTRARPASPCLDERELTRRALVSGATGESSAAGARMKDAKRNRQLAGAGTAD